MIQRGENKIESFGVSWPRSFNHNATPSAFGVELFIIIPWIYNIVSCNVEVLGIEIYPYFCFEPYEGRLFEFPSCVFLCQSLRSLSMKIRDGQNTHGFE